MKRKVGYTWRLRELMAKHQIFTATEHWSRCCANAGSTCPPRRSTAWSPAPRNGCRCRSWSRSATPLLHPGRPGGHHRRDRHRRPPGSVLERRQAAASRGPHPARRMSRYYATDDQYERWFLAECCRCGRRKHKAGTWPDGYVSRTCSDRAVRTRGLSSWRRGDSAGPGEGTDKPLPIPRCSDPDSLAEHCMRRTARPHGTCGEPVAQQWARRVRRAARGTGRLKDQYRVPDRPYAGEATRVANRLHSLLAQIHPSLERVLGPRLQHPAVLVERFGSPAQIRKAGRRRLVTLLRPKALRMAERAGGGDLHRAGVTVPGTDAAVLIVPSLASSLTAVLGQRKLQAGRIEELLEAHSLSKFLTSTPGISVRTGARILIEVGDGSTFPTAGHLAAYAGLARATPSSGSSIRGEQPSRRGNKQLKRAFFLSAFAALGDPASRA